LRCAAPEVTTIGVQWQSVVPEFPPIYDVQYIIRDGEWHTHRFRLPLSPAGTIKLIVCPPTEVDLASVECYVDESSIVTLENPLRQTTNGQLWITYPDFVSLI